MAVEMSSYVTHVNTALSEYLPKRTGYFETIYDAMHYSLEAGGKRIRPILMQLCYEAVGGKESIDAYLCAIEMIHTYSLVHDDLPAMDNDDYRRGKLTNHKVFGEAIAILAGDGLLTEAFHMMLQDVLTHGGQERVHAACILASASGVEGMIGGQVLDMQSENKVIDKDTLDIIHLNKTGALIAAATKMGAVLAGGSAREISLLEAYGKYIGKVFQIVDDILDATSTMEELGKPIGSDMENHKNTYLSFYSVEECYKIAEELTTKAIGLLNQIEGDTHLLEQIAMQLIKRRN
ncbi:MAG: polyprenyl synthetase family protein [Cellulosilyticum sp.]|nr:polyprenyl synthetase family protein [Cellulosilyticum sp.]